MAVSKFSCMPATGTFVPSDRPGLYGLMFAALIPATPGTPMVEVQLPTLIFDLQSLAHTIAAIEDTAAYMGQTDALRAQLEGARIEQANLGRTMADRTTRCIDCNTPAVWEHGRPTGAHAAECPRAVQ